MISICASYAVTMYAYEYVDFPFLLCTAWRVLTYVLNCVMDATCQITHGNTKYEVMGACEKLQTGAVRDGKWRYSAE